MVNQIVLHSEIYRLWLLKLRGHLVFSSGRSSIIVLFFFFEISPKFLYYFKFELDRNNFDLLAEYIPRKARDHGSPWKPVGIYRNGDPWLFMKTIICSSTDTLHMASQKRRTYYTHDNRCIGSYVPSHMPWSYSTEQNSIWTQIAIT